MTGKDLFEKEQALLFETLETIEADCWKRIQKGALAHQHDFHQPMVGTVSGAFANLRTVVLRKVWAEKKQLAFYTDSRSGKINDLSKNNSTSWLFYSARHRLQIRLGGSSIVHTQSSLADEQWKKSRIRSRKCYLATLSPGVPVSTASSGLPVILEQRDPDESESEAGRKNFAVVVTKVKWMEWLWLHHEGHRRAEFRYNENGSYRASWLIP
jgi:pyridoxamine 5'-phosphate oxidase